MKFYSDIAGNQYVRLESGLIEFKDGVYETEDDAEIAVLSKQYRSDSGGWQTEQGDSSRSEVEAEQKETETETEEITGDYSDLTKNELVKLLWERGIEHNKRQSKAELIALLEGVQE